MKRRTETRIRTPHQDRPNPGPWLLLFAVAFALRAMVAWLGAGPGATPPPEIADLDRVAWNLARGAGFSLDGREGPVATASVPPFSAWLASLAYRTAGHQHVAALLLQCAFAALATLLVAWFGAATFGTTIGRLAGWIAAFDPLLLGASTTLLPETLLGALLLAALGTTAAWIKTPHPGRALGVGIGWGLTILAHDGVLLLPLIALAWAWVPLGLTVTPADRNRQAALMLIGAVAILAPWAIRNSLVLRAPVLVTSSAGRALWESNNEITWTEPARRGSGVAIAALETPGDASRGEARRDLRAAAEAARYAGARILEWPAIAAHKLGRLWRLGSERRIPEPPRATDPPLGVRLGGLDLLALGSIVMLPLAAWGIARIVKSPRRWYQSLAILVLAYFSALAVVYHGALRMRVPLEPLLALLAAVGFEGARRRVRSRRLGLRVVAGRR